MSSKAGPALAFYFKHGLEFDALRAMGDRPKTVPKQEWEMFVAVVNHATKQVFAWLRDARERAGQMIPPELAVVLTQERISRREWFLWSQVTPCGTFTLKTKELYLGVCVGTAPEGVAYFAPYFATSGVTSRDQLAERLSSAGIPDAKHPGDWFGVDAVALKIFPLDASTDLDTVTAQSTELFGLVAANWDVVFRG